MPADTSNYDVDTLQPKATLKTSDEFLLLGETARHVTFSEEVLNFLSNLQYDGGDAEKLL